MPREQLTINPELVWDYEIPDDGGQDEVFRRWHIARVLTRGRMKDIREIGLRTIHSYLPELLLPDRIRRFWEWYFNQRDGKPRHGPADSPPA